MATLSLAEALALFVERQRMERIKNALKKVGKRVEQVDPVEEPQERQYTPWEFIEALVAEGSGLLEIHQNTTIPRDRNPHGKPVWAQDPVTHTSAGGATKAKKKDTHKGPWNVKRKAGDKWSYLGSRQAKNRRVVKQQDHKAERVAQKRAFKSDPEVTAAVDKSAKSPSLNKEVSGWRDRMYDYDYDRDHQFTDDEYKNHPGSRSASKVKKRILKKINRDVFNSTQTAKFKSKS